MAKADLPRWGERIFPWRGGLWTVFFLLVLGYARPSLRSCLLGVIPLVGGQLLRFWAAGTIGRYRGEEVGAVQLVTWGPYAFVRNPLYLGNAAIGLGWAIMANSPEVLGVFLLAFLAIYGGAIIPYEESFLEKKFGPAFRAYRDRTPMFFPRLPFPKKWRGPFDRAVLWRSERHSLWVTLGGSVVLISRLWW
ncbi:MAG: hypothetical protein BWY88_00295 [Synergistetes bacterium ADurb.Bin520]|nr:MAG: hypothetical protein BWY88_00295 [Synergistetes bacterium ADurb.Bin520]